jgi:hypothetical protein
MRETKGARENKSGEKETMKKKGGEGGKNYKMKETSKGRKETDRPQKKIKQKKAGINRPIEKKGRKESKT